MESRVVLSSAFAAASRCCSSKRARCSCSCWAAARDCMRSRTAASDAAAATTPCGEREYPSASAGNACGAASGAGGAGRMGAGIKASGLRFGAGSWRAAASAFWRAGPAAVAARSTGDGGSTLAGIGSATSCATMAGGGGRSAAAAAAAASATSDPSDDTATDRPASAGISLATGTSCAGRSCQATPAANSTEAATPIPSGQRRREGGTCPPVTGAACTAARAAPRMRASRSGDGPPCGPSRDSDCARARSSGVRGSWGMLIRSTSSATGPSRTAAATSRSPGPRR